MNEHDWKPDLDRGCDVCRVCGCVRRHLSPGWRVKHLYILGCLGFYDPPPCVATKPGTTKKVNP